MDRVQDISAPNLQVPNTLISFFIIITHYNDSSFACTLEYSVHNTFNSFEGITVKATALMCDLHVWVVGELSE